MWNSRCSNHTGTVIYNHMLQSDYIVTAPDQFTFFPSHRPNMLDIALTKLPYRQIFSNSINDFSSDHNPVLLTIITSTVPTLPPPPNTRVKWNNFTNLLLDQSATCIAPPTNTTDNIDIAIITLTNYIHAAINGTKYLINNKNHHRNPLPLEISNEISIKNRLRWQWQLYHDPNIKR